MRKLLLLLAFFVSACSPPALKGADEAPPEPPATITTPASDLGQWRLSAATGVDVQATENYPLEMLMGVGWIDATSQCVWFRFSWDQSSGLLAVKDFVLKEPAAMCARGLTPTEAAFGAIMRSATRYENKDGVLRFIAPGGEAEFRRPVAPVTNPFQATNPGPFLWGGWRVESVNGAAPPVDATMNALIGFDRFEITSGCVAMNWTFRSEGLPGAMRTDVASTLLPVCERGYSDFEANARLVLTGDLTIEAPDQNTRRIFSKEGAVVLKR